MKRLRSPFLRRIVAGLALAGLVLPLAPAASARGDVAQRLTDVLGHREAVEVAMAASESAADPTRAFLDAYFLATGEDADAVLARLDGHAWWLLTEPLAPVAVLVTASTSSIAHTASLDAAVLRAITSTTAHSDGVVSPVGFAPEALPGGSPLPEQPRGP